MSQWGYVNASGVLVGPDPENREYPEFEVEGDWFYVQDGSARIGIRSEAAHLAAEAEAQAAAIVRAQEEAAQTAAAQAALDALAAPLVKAVEDVLLARQMAPMTPAEQAKVRDGAVYLASRGQFGKQA